jgi:hypothetical protein
MTMHDSKLAMLFAVLVACSSSDETNTSSSSSSSSGGNAQTSTIGPEGGSIVVGGATVTCPKDAVAAPVSVTITEQEGGFPEGFETLSHLFKCEPSGTTFAHPVTMQMPFTDDKKGPATIFWSTGADPTFKDVGGTPTANKTMIATVKHFSAGFVGRQP